MSDSGAFVHDRHGLVQAVLGVVEVALTWASGLAEQGGHPADHRRVLAAATRDSVICSVTWLVTRGLS